MDDCCFRSPFGLIIRVVIAVIVASIILNILAGIVGLAMFPRMDWVWNIIGLLIFIWIAIWIFRRLAHGKFFDEDWAMMTLRRRYAKGDISESEYKRMSGVLGSETRKSTHRRRRHK